MKLLIGVGILLSMMTTGWLSMILAIVTLVITRSCFRTEWTSFMDIWK